MKNYPVSVQNRLASGKLIVRDYLWIGAKTRTNPPSVVNRGFWSGRGDTTAQVNSPSGAVVERDYFGGLGLVTVETVPLVVGLTAQPTTIELAATDDAVLQIVKEYTVKLAPVEIHRGYFNPATRRLDQPALLRFVGFVDDPEFVTAEAGGISTIKLTCAPHTQELLRTSSQMRSDADQRKNRDPNDGGFRHVDKPPRNLEWFDD